MENANEVAKIASGRAGGSSADARKIGGPQRRGILSLGPGDILAFQAEGELVWIVTAKQRLLGDPGRCDLIEERLKSEQFQRVHRNAIVNVNHIRKMSAMSSQRWLVTLAIPCR